MRKKIWIAGLVCSTGLMGCNPTAEKKECESFSQSPDAPWASSVKKTCKLAKEGKMQEASRTVNTALQNFSSEPELHLLNGMIYDALATQGDESAHELALVAYYRAISLDPSEWFYFYKAGLLRLKNQEYTAAQELFSNGLKLNPRSPALLYNLAVASYYAGDLQAALLSIEEAMTHTKTPSASVLRAAAIINAASKRPEQAKTYLAALKKMGQPSQLKDVRNRVLRWNDSYQRQNFQQAALSSASSETDPSDASTPTSSGRTQTPASTQASTQNTEQAIVFDCYILTINEQTLSSKGINIFTNNVQQMANSSNPYLTLLPQSLNYSLTTGSGATLTKQIAWSPIVYNLNIMNVNDNRIQILGRPTLSTFLGTQTQFNSGNIYKAGITGSAGGSVVSIPTGIIMTLTPTKINGELITLDVSIENTIPPDQASVILNTAFSSQVTRFLTTKIQTTLQIKFNETGIVGGDFQKIITTGTDKFPVLGDIPLIQLLTSNETQTHLMKSSLFMITPRKPEQAIALAKKTVCIAQQRKDLTTLKEWLASPDRINIKLTSLGLSMLYLMPEKAKTYIRRGDVFPVDDKFLPQLEREMLPFSAFAYYDRA